MKKLLFFIGILSLSLATFGQYTEDKLPSGLTVTTSMQANDIQVVQKAGESYVKGIKAYHAYLYYKKMLDSIVNLTISGDLSVGDATTLNGSLAVIGSSNFGQSANFYGTIGANNKVYFMDSVYMFDKTYLPSYGYAMVLDTTDNIVKLAPMPDGIPDFNNVAYVNYDIPGDLESKLIFSSYANAVVWINENGSPSSENHWTIVMPSGYCDEDVVADEFIDIQGHVGTVIGTVNSKVVGTGKNVYDVTIRNCVIDTLFVDEAKIMSIEDCVINRVEPVNDADDGYLNINNSTILGGDFSNTTGLLPWKNNMFLALESDIENLISVGDTIEFQGCVFISRPTYFTHSIIELPDKIYNGRAIMEQAFSMSVAPHWKNSVIFCSDSVTFEDGAKIKNCEMKIDTIYVTGGYFVTYNSEITGTKILSSDATIELHQSVANDGNIDLHDTATLKIYDGSEIDGDVIQVDSTTAINDYRNTIAGSSEAASINNVGKLRYREDANNSYLEQVMKTGASTYDWVVVKQNTW